MLKLSGCLIIHFLASVVETIAQDLWPELLSIAFGHCSNRATGWQSPAKGTPRESGQQLPSSRHHPWPHCWACRWRRKPEAGDPCLPSFTLSSCVSALESKETFSQGWVPGASLAEGTETWQVLKPSSLGRGSEEGWAGSPFLLCLPLGESLELERLSDQTCCAVGKVNGPSHSVSRLEESTVIKGRGFCYSWK